MRNYLTFLLVGGRANKETSFDVSRGTISMNGFPKIQNLLDISTAKPKFRHLRGHADGYQN